MTLKGEQYMMNDGDREDYHSIQSSSFPKLTTDSNSSSILIKTDAMKISDELVMANYVIQIVSVQICDNFYEIKMLLAPEADLSSLKITVKGNNLRITIDRPINEGLLDYSSDLVKESWSSNLLKTIIKHQENFLIPDAVKSDRMRAVVDNKHGLLFLTAPSNRAEKEFANTYLA